MLQCSILCDYFIAVREIEIAGIFPVWGIVLILGFMVAVLVAVTSKADRPPIYHCVSTYRHTHIYTVEFL